MFLVKAGTNIAVEVPQSQRAWHTSGWMGYTTKEDKIYDTHEVWDAATVLNSAVPVPDWARRNIMDFDKVVIMAKGKYALVNRIDVSYLD